MPFTANQGARIHWRLQGRGSAPPLVLLHSIGTDLAMYDQVAPYLEPHFLMARIDLRGHGASDATAGDYTLGLLAEDVVAVMDEVGMERAVVCGTSLGGMVAMQLGIDRPDRVAGLVPACTSAAMNPALWPERIATARTTGLASVADGWASRHFSPAYLASHPERAETMTRDLAGMNRDGYAGCAAAIRDMAVLPALPGMTIPTLVIAGEHDTATPFEGHGDRIVAAIPDATARMLPAGHLACIECPDLFADAVRSLADRCA